jgi:hypothetical protein
MGHMRNKYKILVGKPEEKRQVGRPRRGLEGNEALREVRNEDVDCIHMPQDGVQWQSLVNTILRFPFPQKVRNS